MHHLLLREVSALFQGRTPRSVRVGVEQELLTRDAVDGSAVAIERGRRAVAGTPYERWVGFEPGGQVELSLPCAPSIAEFASLWQRTIVALRSDCARAGVLLDAVPADPRSPADVPRQLGTGRYVAMERHFDAIGPAGRRMMRQTASTQVCLDWWPGEAGREQWRLLLLAGPLLAAAYARSSGPRSRLATWLAVDPGRTAYDDRLLRGTDPVTAYAAFAAGAAVFAMPDDDPVGDSGEPATFAHWARAHTASAAAVAHHLTTLFPPVRPRGRYLEVRFLDVQPDAGVVPVAEVLARLLYDDEVRRRALRIVDCDVGRLADRWQQAALRPEQLVDRASAVLRLATGPTAGPAPELVGVA